MPDAPIIGFVTNVAITSATVAFTPGYNGGSAVYFYTAYIFGDYTNLPVGTSTDADSTSVNVSGLIPGTTYQFIVVATNGVGNSEPSAPSNAITTFESDGTMVFFTDNTSVMVHDTIIDGQKIAYEKRKSVAEILSVSISYKVTQIKGFANATNLISLELDGATGTRGLIRESALETIGDRAFLGCIMLDTINIPRNVKYIGQSAFQGCTRLINILWTDPAGLETLGSHAFDTQITSPGTVRYYKTQGPFSLPSALNPKNHLSVYSSKYTVLFNPNPVCFNKGTEILCLNKVGEEEYILVENLKKGDLVKSYKHGYRKIDLILNNTMTNTPSNWRACMYKMRKTETNGLTKDLIVTGGHAVLVDDLGELKDANDAGFGHNTPRIDGKHLLLSSVSKDFEKLENTNVYAWYHFTLECEDDDDRRFGVWANGILTETPSKNQLIRRRRFPRSQPGGHASLAPQRKQQRRPHFSQHR